MGLSVAFSGFSPVGNPMEEFNIHKVMSQYKCVPGPKNLVVEEESDMDKAVVNYAELINRECKDGWRFFSLEEISVTQKPGCLAGIFGASEKTVHYNMLIFIKD